MFHHAFVVRLFTFSFHLYVLSPYPSVFFFFSLLLHIIGIKEAQGGNELLGGTTKK